MPKKLTTEEYVKRMVTIHGDKIDYTKVVYVDSITKIELVCKICDNVWWMTPNCHTQGQGCPKCGKVASGKKQRKSTADFIQELQEIFPDQLDVSKVLYRGNKTEVELRCLKHNHWFSKKPNKILTRESACPLCARESSNSGRPPTKFEDFVFMGDSEHSNAYIYCPKKYIDMASVIDITCPDHGVFQQKCTTHIRGSGCPKCASYGFNPSKPGLLYVLKFEDIVKVGIANRDIGARIYEINKTSGYVFKEVKKYTFEDGGIPEAIEDVLLSELKASNSRPQEKFSGSTECFYNVDLPALLSRIEALVAEHSPQ